MRRLLRGCPSSATMHTSSRGSRGAVRRSCAWPRWQRGALEATRVPALRRRKRRARLVAGGRRHVLLGRSA